MLFRSYTNIGVCYSRISDFSKAALYLEKAESLYLKGPIKKGETYINLINSLASTYFFLNMRNKSDEYFEKGIRMAESSISMLSFLFINNFAIILGNAGKIQKGEALIKNSLSKARKYYGTGSRDYIEVLNNYAQYLSNYNIDIDQSLRLYEQCIAYIEKNSDDLALREPVMLGYSNALSQKGENLKALQIIQNLLFKGNDRLADYKSAMNPAFEDIEADNGSLSVLRSKYKILWKIYEESGDNNFLLAAAETSDLILSVLEKVRINISEEESRIVLGDKYRDSYLFAIRDFDLCYKMTGNMQFLVKAFEFSEKSKVAGLLASTRELKASQFHIPDNISELERKLQSEISFYNSKVSDENSKINPDSFMVSEWRELILESTRKRDSLINIFENQFPGYYLIKYNTQVISPDDIPLIAGSRTTYLNYVLGDTSLYIFVVNKKFRQLISIPVDSSFFRSVKEFRKLLSTPSPQGNAKDDYMKYQEHGLKLYKTLVEPVKQYLVSDKVLISPDYLLSYIPFETIPVSEGTSDEIRYKDLHYLMNDLRISYTYSATFMAESDRKSVV